MAKKHLRTVIIFLSLFLLFVLPLSAFANETLKNDSIKKRSRFKIGGIPVFAYDADLGLKYGAVINLFDFGDDKIPPNFEQYLMLRLTNTTRGTVNLQALLESESLINNTKVLAEASYIIDKRLDFFGFNGTQAK